VDLPNIQNVENQRYLKFTSGRIRDGNNDDHFEDDRDAVKNADDSNNNMIKSLVGGGVGALRKGVTGTKGLLRGFGSEEEHKPQKKQPRQSRQSKFGVRNKLKSLASPQPKNSDDSNNNDNNDNNNSNDNTIPAIDDDMAFKIVTPERSYIFVASSVEEKNRWVKTLGDAAVKSHEFYYASSPTFKNVKVPEDVSSSRGSATNNDILNPLSLSGGSDLFGLHKLSYDDVIRRRLPGWPHLVRLASERAARTPRRGHHLMNR